MGTKRTRRTRGRRKSQIPEWVVRFLETGEAPPKDTDDHEAYLGWEFFGEEVPGLDAYHTHMKNQRIRRANH